MQCPHLVSQCGSVLADIPQMTGNVQNLLIAVILRILFPHEDPVSALIPVIRDRFCGPGQEELEGGSKWLLN